MGQVKYEDRGNSTEIAIATCREVWSHLCIIYLWLNDGPINVCFIYKGRRGLRLMAKDYKKCHKGLVNQTQKSVRAKN